MMSPIIADDNSKENVKNRHHWSFVKEIHEWQIDSPHKRPVMRKVFPCYDLIIWCRISHEISACFCVSFCRVYIIVLRDFIAHCSRSLKWHLGSRTWSPLRCALTRWERDKVAAIFQTTFWNGFSPTKMIEFRLKIHWSVLLGVWLTIFLHWFR